MIEKEMVLMNVMRTENNFDGIKKLVKLMKLNFKGLGFVNLNDFDRIYVIINNNKEDEL